jgi:hypothetical protein
VHLVGFSYKNLTEHVGKKVVSSNGEALLCLCAEVIDYSLHSPVSSSLPLLCPTCDLTLYCSCVCV